MRRLPLIIALTTLGCEPSPTPVPVEAHTTASCEDGILAEGTCHTRFARIEELARSCDAGDATACASHGFTLAHGLGAPADLALGVRRAQRACDAGEDSGCTLAKILTRSWTEVAARCTRGDTLACDALGDSSDAARDARALLDDPTRVAVTYGARRREDLDASEQRAALDALVAQCGPDTCAFAHGARQFWAIEHILDQWRGLSLGEEPARQREVLAQRERRMRALEDNLGRLSRHPSPVFAQGASLRLAEAREDFAGALDRAGIEPRRALELRTNAAMSYAAIVEDALSGKTPRSGFAIEAFRHLSRARGYYAAMPEVERRSLHH